MSCRESKDNRHPELRRNQFFTSAKGTNNIMPSTDRYEDPDDLMLGDNYLSVGAPVLCKPAVAVPEYVISQAETLGLASRLHAGHPQVKLVLRLIENTGVAKRHLIRPIEDTLRHTGFGHRNQVLEAEAKKRIPAAVTQALANAGLTAGDIGAIVLVSCTGFMMPSLTAWMINELGFAPDTAQLPIAQLGCAAGTAAVNRASDFCTARPGGNALIVACEFCSLCYQPDDLEVGSLLSNGLFGGG